MKKIVFLLFIFTHLGLNAAQSKSLQSGWTIGVSGFYPTGQRVFEFSGKRTSNNQSLTGQFEFESQLSPYIFLKRSKENSFGFTFGYEMIFESTLIGGTVKLGSTSSSAKTYSYLQSFKVDVVHIGTEYRFNRLYFPAEMLLIMVPEYGMKSGILGFCSGVGSGYSGGVGYHINRFISAELNYRSIGMKYCEILATGTNPPKDDYGTLTSNELVLNLSLFL